MSCYSSSSSWIRYRQYDPESTILGHPHYAQVRTGIAEYTGWNTGNYGVQIKAFPVAVPLLGACRVGIHNIQQ